jgi:hypothetical protein
VRCEEHFIIQRFQFHVLPERFEPFFLEGVVHGEKVAR